MRRARLFSFGFLLLALVAGVPAHARIGEKASELRARFGKPEATPQKNVLVWLIEEPAGALLYTVTLDEKEVSMAEGLKPFRQAKMTEQSARNFIAEQLSALPENHRAREFKSGDTYIFGGEKMTCGTSEKVIVDDEHGLLVVWTLAPSPSVLAVTREMLQRARR